MKKIVLLLITLLCFVTAADGAKKFTLVIDAGHGGHDAGAVGAVSKEKNLTLKYALAFGKMVEQNCPDVNVIYTRKTDKFVELYRRAEIANKNKADLFISIHINSLPKGRVARGFQTYTLGASKRTGKKNGVLDNLEVAKRENAVIFLEKDYKKTYHGYDPNSAEVNIMYEFIQDKNMANSVELAKCMQKHVCRATGRQDMGAQQDNLAVLRLSSMPGCLVECGFISTRDEENFMNSKEAAEKYARGLFNAFQAYRKRFGGTSVAIPYEPEPAPKENKIPQIVPSDTKKSETKPSKPAKAEQPAPEPPSSPSVPEQEQPVQADTLQKQPAEEPRQEEPQSQPEAATPAVQPAAGPVFKVQILASSALLKSGDARFKGLTDVDNYQEGGMYKYTVGASEDYNAIYRLRKEIADKFPQAFIVAFKEGARIDVNKAIAEFKQRKGKK